MNPIDKTNSATPGETRPPDDETVFCAHVEKKVIRRIGGRHLVFRIKPGGFRLWPRPYALISNIEGSILAFYGAGQIWVTHRKLRRINEWWVRVPRLVSKRIHGIIEHLEPEIAEFIEHIRDLDLIGTLVVERRVIEFHWTVPPGGYDESIAENRKRQAVIDLNFNKLASAFASYQLTGDEGVDQDFPESQPVSPEN